MNNQTAVIPSDIEIQSLRETLAEEKRIAAYQSLQQELRKVQDLQKEQIQVVEGNLHQPDTDKILKTKRAFLSPFEVVFNPN